MSMNRVIEYAGRWDASFASRIRGATPAEIAELEDAMGEPVPLVYRAFLEVMGNDHGGLSFSFGGESKIHDLIELHRACLVTGEASRPAGSCLVGICPQPGDLIVLHPSNHPNPPVFFADVDIGVRFADSLENLLLHQAFAQLRQPAFHHKAVYMDRKAINSLGRAAEAARSLAFLPEWFSDSVAWCAERPDAALMITQYSMSNVVISLTAEGPEQLGQLGKAFEREVGVERVA